MKVIQPIPVLTDKYRQQILNQLWELHSWTEHDVYLRINQTAYELYLDRQGKSFPGDALFDWLSAQWELFYLWIQRREVKVGPGE